MSSSSVLRDDEEENFIRVIVNNLYLCIIIVGEMSVQILPT